MSAVISRPLRFGAYSSVAATGEMTWEGDEPVIYGHVLRHGWRAYWRITASKTGDTLAEGRTWTRGGAWVEAIAAAHKPGWPSMSFRGGWFR